MTFKLWSNSSDSSEQWEKLLIIIPIFRRPFGEGESWREYFVYEAKSRQFRDRFNRVTGGEGRLKRRSSLDTQGAQLPTKMDVEAKEER